MSFTALFRITGSQSSRPTKPARCSPRLNGMQHTSRMTRIGGRSSRPSATLRSIESVKGPNIFLTPNAENAAHLCRGALVSLSRKTSSPIWKGPLNKSLPKKNKKNTDGRNGQFGVGHDSAKSTVALSILRRWRRASSHGNHQNQYSMYTLPRHQNIESSSLFHRLA